MGRVYEGEPDGAGLRIAIVATRWNGDIIARLIAGARGTAQAKGIGEEQIDLAYCPGAF